MLFIYAITKYKPTKRTFSKKNNIILFLV